MRRLLFVGAITFTGSAFGNDPANFPNLAEKKERPSGDGLAAAFSADVGLKENADVIFADESETGAPGERDGERAFWIDGTLRGPWKGINWRKTGRK